MIQQNDTKTCAACGGPVIRPVGKYRDFCCYPCLKAGRLDCLQCGKPLLQTKQGRKKDFCNDTCSNRYRTVGPSISPSYWEEMHRSTCKLCGKPITQSKNGGRRLFCSPEHGRRYHYARKHNLSLLEKWGGYASQTRKALQEIENLGMPGLAKRLATAIDREYVLRRPDDAKRARGGVLTYTCKKCGRDFHRKSLSPRSREYCDVCQRKERAPARFNWDEVTEIRRLYESGVSQVDLARKYCASDSIINYIVRNDRWKKPNSRSGENNARAKLTWEDIDEIRRLHEVEHLGCHVLARKYCASPSTIKNIFNNKIWKPENDPRRK